MRGLALEQSSCTTASRNGLEYVYSRPFLEGGLGVGHALKPIKLGLLMSVSHSQLSSNSFRDTMKSN